MARLYKPTYTRPIPQEAKRITRKKRRNGETVSINYARLEQKRGRGIAEAEVTADGEPCRVESEAWYARFVDGEGFETLTNVKLEAVETYLANHRKSERTFPRNRRVGSLHSLFDRG